MLAVLVAAVAGASGDAAGAHVVVPLPDAATERAVLAAAADRGVRLDGLARHFSGPPDRAGLVLGYAGTRLDQGLPVVRGVLAAIR